MDPTDLLSTPANYATPAQLQQMREYAASLQKNVLSGNLPISTRHPAAGIINALLQGAVSGSTFNRANEAQQQQRGALADFIESLPGTGGGNPAGPTGAMNQPIPGTMPSQSTASADDQEDYIKQAAAARGIDPNVALQVHRSEASPKAYAGDDGSSFGPFQLHYGGVAPGGNASSGLGDEFTKATGLDARDPATAHQQIDFALDYAAKNGWGPWHGWKGEPMAGIGGSAAQQPTQVAMNGAAMPSSDTQSMVTALAGGSGTQPQQPQAHGGGMQLAQNSPNPYAPMFHMLAQGVRNDAIDPQMAAIQAMQLRQSMMPQYQVDPYGRVIRSVPGNAPQIIPGQFGPGKEGTFMGMPTLETLGPGGQPQIRILTPNSGGPASTPQQSGAAAPPASTAAAAPPITTAGPLPQGTTVPQAATPPAAAAPAAATRPGGGVPPMPGANASPQDWMQWQQDVAASKAGAAKSAEALSEATAKGLTKPIDEAVEQGTKAGEVMNDLDTLQNAYDSAGGNLNGGPFADKILKARQAINEFLPGTNIVDQDKLNASQIVQKVNAGLATKMVKELTSRGTQMELKLGMQNNPGIMMSDRASKYMINLLRQVQTQKQELGVLASKAGYDNPREWNTVQRAYYETHPLISPMTGKPLIGQEAVNADLAQLPGGSTPTANNMIPPGLPPVAPPQTRTIGNKSYIKQNGQWFETDGKQ